MPKKKPHKKNAQAVTRKAFVFEELEPRLLLSADLPIDVPDAYVTEDFRDQEILQDINAQQTESQDQDAVSLELIFVDTDTPEYQTLLSDLLTYPDDTTRYQVFELDNNRDGIAQITEILGAYTDVSAVHILSHGTEAAIDLGGSTLDSDALAANAERVSTWGSAFTEDGDILIYGCDLAATSEGQLLVNSIATLTGADVAASDDLTGNAQLGGDWELEYSTGSIESTVAISSETQNSWSNVLAFNVNTTADTPDANPGDTLAEDGSSNTSLRAAIEEANALAGADTITIGAGTFTLSGGQLVISSDVTITGAGPGLTIIDGASLDRVFEITNNATVTLEGMTITGGGNVVSGGGISVSTGNTLTLVNAVLTGNDASQGGAIYNNRNLIMDRVSIISNTAGIGGGLFNSNTAAITNSLFYDNTASNDGGGIWVDGNGTSLTLTNTTLSGNTADTGGGLFSGSLATLTNVTITDNTATTNGGGIAEGTGTVTTELRNTIVAGNTSPTGSDIDGSMASLGYNVLGDTTDSSGWIASDQQNVDPLLGTLADNGGPTLSHTLLVGSTAIDGGDPGTTQTFDQRGFVRDGSVDIGAFEYGAGPVVHQFIVTTTADSGAGSLRQAIIDANATTNDGVPDVITFDMGADGSQQTINLLSALDPISEAVIIDGFSQYGALTPTVPLIELNGAATSGASGLTLAAGSDGSTIRGLVINRFDGIGIYVNGSSSNVIQGNYIGTDNTGMVDLGNTLAGVYVTGGASDNVIGGAASGEGNVISGNDGAGISLTTSSGAGNVIQGNYIGVAVDGVTAMTTVTDVGGIEIGSSDNVVGGTNAGEGNVIANYQGTTATGVWVYNGATGVSILGNSIYNNSNLGIELGAPYGANPNDLGDADTGINNLQNFPVLSTASTTGSQITITGSINSTANSYYRIEFFANTSGDASGYGEGETYLGFANVATDGSGNASFNAALTASVADGAIISATATKSDATYSTFTDSSEFSLNIAATDTTAPTAVNNTGASVTEGATHTITNTELRFDDSVQPASSVIYTVTASPVNGQLELTTNPDVAITSFTQAQVDAGEVVYVHDGSATTADEFKFDVDDGQGNTTVGQVITGITNLTNLTNDAGKDRDAVMSPDGTQIAFRSDRVGGNIDIYVMDVDGSNVVRLTNNAGIDENPSWSPDGSQIVFSSDRDGTDQIYVMNADGSAQTRLTNNLSIDKLPSWSPDGTQIVFSSDRDGNNEIYVMDANGTNQIRLTTDLNADSAPSWSPDGSQIVFTSERDGNREIYVMDADGSNQTRITDNAAKDTSPKWSPDGSHILFMSDRDGNTEIYVMDADGSNPTRLTNDAETDQNPSWSTDGSQILFQTGRDGNNEIYVADVLHENRFAITVTAANSDPEITSDGAGATASVSAAENTTAVTTVTATDADGDQIEYTISGGADAALFDIDRNTGVLTFLSAPDYEAPTDANADNVYEVVVMADDQISTPDTQAISVTVTNVNDAPTFIETEGVSATDVGNIGDYGQAITVQSDGKVLIAGYSASDLAITRYNPDGTLDTSFGGGDGIVTTDISGSLDYAYDVVVQSDGKIVVTGASYISGNYDILLVRYNSDGTLDTGFGGGDGIVATDATGVNERGRSVTLQSDGKIVVAGYSDNGNQEVILTRYNSDGTLDTSFGGGDGIATTDVGGIQSGAYDVTVQADGKILLTGFTDNGTDDDVVLIRYNSDGTLDTGFGGGDGIAITSIAGDDRGYSVSVQADGKILVSGYGGSSGSDFLLMRYNTDGTLDTGFGGGDGIVTTNFGGSDYGNDVVVQADGKIVVGGYKTSPAEFAIARYNSDGTLDTSFGGGDGMVTTAIDPTNSSSDFGYSMTMQDDGKILVGGGSYLGTTGYDFSVARYNSDGTLDTTFGEFNTLNNQVQYTEDGAAVLLDEDVNVSDAELDALNSGLGNYSGASVTLVRSGGANAEDVLGFSDGNGITLIGGNLIKNGQVIAFFDTTTTVGELVITFTDANGEIPTSSDVDLILQQFTYLNSSDSPPSLVQMSWTFDDGNSGAQGSGGALQIVGSTNVSITAVNDTPVVDLNGTNDAGINFATTFTEGDAAVSITDTDAIISDVDDTSFQYLGINLLAMPDGANELIVVGGYTFAYGTSDVVTRTIGSTDFEIDFDGTGFSISKEFGGNMPLADLQALLLGITYENTSQSPTAGNRTIDIEIQDASGLLSTTATSTITVSAVNDAPVLSGAGLYLTAITEDTVVNNGDLVSAIIASAGGDPITDVDAGAVEGIAIFNLSNGNGTWEYDTGSGWTAVGSVSVNSSLLLSDTDSLRFVPNANWNGTELVSFAAWDQTSGTAGTKVDTSAFGGTTAFSSGTAIASITVTGVNDDPIVTNLTGDVLNYTEGDGAVLLEQGSDTLVSDIDSSDFSGGSLNVEVDSGLVSAEDVFTVRNQGTGGGQIGTSGSNVTYGGIIIGTFTGGTGVDPLTITFNSNATVAAVNALVQNITYENTNISNPTEAARSVTIDIYDGDGGASQTQNLTINVTAINHAPEISTTGTQLAYTENDAAVVIDAGLTVLDVDSATLASASVRITSGFASAEDTLGFVDQLGITGVYNAGTGILSLTGSASAADYQTALRSITYTNSSELPSTANRVINFQISDGTATSGANRTITVASINDDPINAGSLPTDVTVTEDVMGFVDLSSFTLSDPDHNNQLVTVTLSTGTGGKLWASSDFDVIVSGSGFSTMTLTGGVNDLNNFFSSAFRFSYRHDTPHTAGDNADTIQIEINDNGNTGTGGSGTILLGTVNVDITPVNDAPVRTAGTVNNMTVLEDSGFTSLGLGSVAYGTGGGSDESSQTLTYEVTTIPDANFFGKIYLADGTTQVTTGFYTLTQIQGMQFQPVADESGGPSFFSYTVTDSGGTANGGANSISESIQITVTPVNDAPSMIMAGDSLAYTENDGPVVVDAALAVSDVDNANLTGATVTIVGGFVSAEDTLAFVDQLGLTGSYDAGTGVLTLSGTASVADYQTALRSITYENTSETPNAANRIISFQVSDGTASGGNSRTVTITTVNDAPVLNVAGTSTLTQINEGDINNPGDSVAEIIASAGGNPITDVDSSAVEGIAITWTDSSNGTWQYSNDAGSMWNDIGAVGDSSAFLLTDAASNRIRFVPDENYNGTAQFSYRAWDRTDSNANATAGVDVSLNDGATAYSAATEMANLTIIPVEVVLYLSTSNDVSISGTPGLDSWAAGELLAMGDPNVDLEPGTTDGTFYSFLDLRDFDTGAVPPKVDGVHQVSENVTIGGNGGPSMDLFLGDVLFSINSNSTQLTGSDAVEITTNKKSLYLFRPDTPGDYSAGTFSVVLDNFSTNEVEGISLVEADTMVGDTLLQAGSFIYNPGNSTDIWLYTVDGAGEGTTSGNAEILITGGHINMNNASAKISGLDLIEATIDIGDTRLTAGNILVTLDGNDSGIGSNNLTVTSNDVFYLDVTTTTLGVTNTSVANAYLLIEGADLNLDTADEEITAISLELKFGSGGNEDPDISFPGGSISYTENDPAVFIDAGATVIDPDSLDFSTGILRVDFSAGGTADDRLTIRNEGNGASQIGVVGSNVTYGGVTIGTFTGGIGTSPLVINFNSNATSAVVQATLRNITYENVSDDPATTPRNVRVVLSDGDGGASNVENKTINVTAVNDAPVIETNTGMTVAEGSTGTVITAAMLNEGDPDDIGSGVTYTVTTVPAYGTLYLSGTALGNNDTFTQADIDAGLITYDHDGTQNLSDSFTFSLADGGEDSAASLTGQVFSITVTNVNDAAAGLPAITGAAQEDQTLTADTSGISDADGLGAFSYQWLSDGVVIDGATGSSYTLGDDDVGARISVQVSYTDAYGATEGPLTSAQTAPVTNINDVPVANADTASTAEDVALNNIDVLGNDTDVDGDPLSVTGASALSGTVTVNGDGTLNYTPNLNFNGTDTISYDISDGNGGVDTGTLTITVTAVNDNPVANAGTASTSEDIALNNIDVLSNDTDVEGDTLSVTGATAVNGTVTVNGDGTLNYTPNADFNGTDTISYDIADGNGGTATGTLTITVTAVNDNPVANADSATTAEDVVLNNIDVLGNDTDVDGDTLSVTGASALNGTVTVNGDGTLNYTPTANFNGTDTISYDIADGNGGTATGTLTITVTAVNDNPVANADTATTAEDVALNNIDVLGNDTDVDGGTLSVTGASALNGTVTVNGDGTLNYTPNLNFNGTDTISYDIADGNGGTATGTLTITVTAVNDNPVANADTATTAEDVALNNIDVLGNDTDVDGDTLSVTGATAVNGTVTVNGDGTLNYTPNLNFNGTDTISYDIADGNGGTATGTLTITVTAVNDNPVANADTATTAEDVALNNLNVLGNDTDVDGDALSVTGATAVNGTVTVNGDGTLNYTPDANFNGTDTISYDLSDGNGGTATGTLTITVTVVNDNPVANADAATTAEDVALNNINVLGNDTDVDGDTLSVTGASALNGTVTVNGDGTLNYTPTANFNGTDTISYDIADGNGGTATGTLTITVTAVNDNPVANADTATTAEDVILNNIDVLGNDTDVDGDTLSVTGATAVNGTVTVNGDGTLNYTPNADFNGTDTISYDIADGNGGTATGTLTITVTAVNDNPVANADAATTAEDVALNNINVLGNDTDVDGDALSVTGATAVNGTVTVNGDGTLNYTPNLNFNGTDTISYDIADGNGGTATGTLTITVTVVNDNPVANADSGTTAEDVALNNINVLANDTDVDGDTLSVTGASALNGTVTVNGDGTLNYTPNLNFNGTDTISYEIADGNGGTATGTLTITVTAVNDNPVANADTATTAEDVALNNIDVLGNDTDVDGDTLSVTGATAVNGTVTVNGDGTLNYTPNLNFNGTDTISYDIADGNGGTATGTLTITVTAVNDNPVANADTATTAEDVALNNLNVLGNDTDVDGDALSVTGATAVNGTVTVNGDGTLNYTPNLNFNGTDTISYDIADGNGGTTTGTLTITVTAVNDNPVANADTATTAEDVALNNIDVLANDTDVDGDILSVTGATAVNGTVTVNGDGTLNYTPNADFNSTDTISYDIADGNGGTATGTLTITVTAVNDNPVANADTGTTAEDVELNNIDVLGNDTDVDGDTLSVTGATAVNGTVTVNGDGTLNYTPNLNFNGTDTISYDIADGNGGTATGTLTITVTGVNNNPVANADTATTAEDVALNNIDVLTNDTDVDGDTLSVTGASALNGTVTVNGDGTLNYTPNANFNGTDTISYDIADGNGGTATGTLTITVTAVNDNPVANADNATTAEDVALNNIDVLTNDTDVDGDTLSVTGASALNGTVTVNGDGTLNYTPNLNFNGTDTISYDIADGNGGMATGTLTITVTAVNDNPLANADTATTAEDVALNNIDVLGNDTDVDGDTLSVTGASALNGTVTVNGDGTLNYTPDANFNGTDTISYDLSDGNGGTATGTLTITVTVVNDNPVANADSGTTAEDIALNNIDVLGNDTDVDGDTLSVTGATAVNGTVTVNGDGTLNYTPNADFNGTDTISYGIADGNGGTATGTLTITVTAVNDNPVANADTATTAEDVVLNNIDVLTNDTDVDGDTLSVTGASALNGTVTVNGDGTLNYTPNLNFNGTDTISYDIADDNGGTATGTLTITVTAVNDNPIANADTATTTEDVILNNIDVLGNDTDVDGDTLSVTGASALNGTVTVNGDGTLNYTPNLNFNGTDTISYEIADGNGGVATGTLTITVTAVNDNPVANADTVTTAEDIALNNIDVLANDTDVDGDILSVTGATAVNGTVTVNGDGTLNYTPNADFNSTDTISYDIADGNGGTATGTLTITVTAVNDNPVANADTGTTAEDVELNNIDVLSNDTDVEGDTLSVTGATAVNGTVTVNGDGTLNYTPNADFNGTDTISYDIADGNGGTATGTLTITVTAVNDNPVANADAATTAEDVALNNINVLGNDTDVDGDALSVTGATAVNGTVTVNGDGTLNYTPNLNFNGTDTISYDIADGNGGVATGTLTITVTAVNDNPVANADAATTAEDIALNNIDVLANDADVDGDTLSVTGASALNGMVTVNGDGTLNYTPNLNFNGTDTISYDIADDNGGTATGTLTITVTAVNDNPIANADTATTTEDVILNNIDVLGNDTDVDGDTLSVTGATAVNGTVTVNGDGTLNYTPNLNFNGTDTISYDIADGNGGTATGTLTITVTAVNDNPVANADTATTAEDVALNNLNVLGNDTDVDGDALSVTGATAVNGTVTVNGDGTLNYTPNLNFNGMDTISYDIADGNGGTATGTLTITVTVVNDNPVANADSGTTAEDVALNNINVLANDADVDGDTLSVTGASALNGTVTVNGDGTLNYTPNLNFNGTDTISYDIADDNGGTATGTLTITVTAVNDNPIANADTATTTEDVILNNIDVLGNDTDVDGDTLSVTGASALNGTVTVNGDGTLNYTPNLNFNGTDTISYDIADGNGGMATGTLTITVTAVNDNPVANADTATTAEDVVLNNIDVLGNDTDVDGDTLSVTGATAVNGTVTVNGDGTLNYTPNLNFNGTDTISYDITDGNGGTATGTLTITVTAVNDNPVANADSGTTAEDVALNNINVLGNDTDVDGDTLSVTGASALNGTVTVNGDGTLNYTPNANFNGTDTIIYDIADGNGGTATGTLTITVTAVNDNPVANADTATTAEDVVLNNIDVLGNDTDVDGDALSVTGATAVNGTVTVNGDGTLNYTPNLNFNGTDTISYDIADGNGGTATGTLTITVTAVNDNPVANADTATTAEDVALNNLNVLGNDTDVDGDALSVAGATAVNGTVTVNGDGTLNYTPNLNFNGTDTISYDIADGNGGMATGTLTITVTAVNDNPVANADTATTAEDVVLNNIDVLGNDTDVDGDTLSVTGATAVNGTVTVNGDGTLNYTPDANFNGTDTISYDLSDGNGGTATGTLTITVTVVNDNPVANADAATTAEDVALNNINVLGNDTDVDGDTLSVTGASALNGTVTVNGDGTLNYTPDADFNGTDTISYDIADGNGGTATGTLTITVTAANNNPVANVDTATTAEDVVLNNINVLGNDTDVDGDPLSVTGASAANGSVTINPDGTLNYTPNANFHGADTISYDIADGNGGASNTGRVDLTVSAVNDAPINNTPAGQTTLAGTPLVFSSLDGNSITVVDTDGTGSVLKVSLTASNGTLSLSGTSGLAFNAGDGTADAVMTFTGTAADINAALDGLLFQPDADYQGFATVQLITDDLGNFGAGGVLNTMDSVSISVIEDDPVTENLPPLDELIIDYPDAVPSPTVLPSPVQQEVSEDTTASSVDSYVSDTPVVSASGGLRALGDVSVHESIASIGGEKQEQADDKSIATRVWNAIMDPLVSLQMLTTLPPGAMIWDFLDLMTDQITTDDPETADFKGYVLGTTATGVTFAFSAGYVSWLLRAGYLSAALLSSAPMWRQLDPLPILSRSTKKKRGKDEEGQDSTDSGDREVENIFNPGAHCSSDKEVS